MLNPHSPNYETLEFLKLPYEVIPNKVEPQGLFLGIFIHSFIASIQIVQVIEWTQ